MVGGTWKSPASVLVEMTNEFMCGGTVVSTFASVLASGVFLQFLKEICKDATKGAVLVVGLPGVPGGC